MKVNGTLNNTQQPCD